MYRNTRFLVTLVTALVLLIAVPMAVSARDLPAQRTALGAAQGWLGAAFHWVQEALRLHGRTSRHPSPGALASIHAASEPDPDPGSCIDPQGNRYPPPCIWGD
ncbi:MAG TPA: hypothetical protein VF173_08940 [Thermoanaerobaculia bacterium]|nr:hypothetical protein [Thermoanaerobaculia bacterium]